MRNRVILFTLALAGFLSFWLVMAAPNPAVQTNLTESGIGVHIEPSKNSTLQFQLDHYLVYLVDPRPANAQVQLMGQFETAGQFLTVRVRQYERFLVPVSKNGPPVLDPHAHLNWYMIQPFDNEPNRTVSLCNQFGLQTIKIGRPLGLLVPTEKIEPGSQFPANLDHYKVYVVLDGQAVNQPVHLADQFGDSDNVAEKPAYFAVPVAKIHAQDHYPIHNPNDHLVFYTLSIMDIARQRQTDDQFIDPLMRTRWIEMLGVPTQKLAWSTDI